MAEIQTALIMPFKFPTTGYTASVVDAAGTNTRTFIPLSQWYIMEFSINASPAGTVADPINFLKHLEVELGVSRYEIKLSNLGFITIRNLTSTAATLTFGTTAIPYALGFQSNVISVPALSTVTSTYQPTHCVFAFSRENDTGWQSKGQIFAVADLPDGSVYGWGNGTARFTRKFNLKYQPKDYNYVTGNLNNVTPAYPSIKDNSAQWKNPTDDPTVKAPWSIHQFLNSCVNNGQGKIIAACFGNFKNNIDGSDYTFEQVSLSAESIKAEHFSLSIPGYDKYRNVDNLTFSYYANAIRETS